MDLTQTTILPLDDGLAEKELRELIVAEPVVLLIVFGEGVEVEGLLADADKVAAKFEGLAQVVWARRRDAVEGALRLLQPKGWEAAIPDSRAVAVSVTDEIRDVIRAGEGANFARLFFAFNNALRE